MDYSEVLKVFWGKRLYFIKNLIIIQIQKVLCNNS